MLHVPASELQKQFGHYQDKALVEPVFVTRNGRERAVLLSVSELSEAEVPAEYSYLDDLLAVKRTK